MSEKGKHGDEFKKFSQNRNNKRLAKTLAFASKVIMERLKLENKRPQKRIVKVVKLGAIVFLLVFSFEIWMVTRLSTYGDKIQELKVAQANLELENQVLENQIAEKSSLMSIEEKAVLFGFSANKNLDYIKPISLASAN